MLRRLTLRELAATPEGEALAAQLISVLNTEHLAAPGGPPRRARPRCKYVPKPRRAGPSSQQLPRCLTQSTLHHCAGSAADDLASQLQGGAPAFFKVCTPFAAPQPLHGSCLVPVRHTCPFVGPQSLPVLLEHSCACTRSCV